MNPQSATINSCMNNQTSQPEVILLGLSDFTYSRIPLVLFFLLIYFFTLAGNILIIALVVTDSHLQTPMYFFLGNLSVLDIATPSLPASHLPVNIFPGKKLILYSTCVAQVFFFCWFICTEVFILAIMSYDRYAAICHPLRYTTMISIHLCIQLAISAWIFGNLYSLLNVFYSLKLAFFGPISIQGLFCELYQLIQLSCSDTHLNNLLLSMSGIFGAIVIILTLLSYVFIFKSIVRIKTEDGRLKAFSTCSSHLLVVIIFYGTGLFNYLRPSDKEVTAGRMISIVYTLFTSFLNPIIYSLRNKELQGSLHRTLVRVSLRT
ncbi:olfactory receptor 5B12-like [Hyperolius riggenbachi]|uniref:olfactory receptor 5B12-like n=1 Tax=Hyperolius riggenbachi TaxID=752182 RepID=UPI0035A2C56A